MNSPSSNFDSDPPPNSDCDAKNVTDVVNKLCLNQNSCDVASYPFFGDPCYQVYKSLIIQVGFRQIL